MRSKWPRSTGNPRFTPEAIKNNRALIDVMERIGRQKHATPAQLALAWLLTRGDHVIPIPGSTRIERVEENAGATRVILTAEDIRALDALAPTVAGERYPEGGMRAVNR